MSVGTDTLYMKQQSQSVRVSVKIDYKIAIERHTQYIWGVSKFIDDSLGDHQLSVVLTKLLSCGSRLRIFDKQHNSSSYR